MLDLLSLLSLDLREGYSLPCCSGKLGSSLEGSLGSSLSNCHVFMSERELLSAEDVVPFLEWCLDSKKSVLLIAPNVSGDALRVLSLNKIKSGLSLSVLIVSGISAVVKASLQDVAVLTGGAVITSSLVSLGHLSW